MKKRQVMTLIVVVVVVVLVGLVVMLGASMMGLHRIPVH